jgi:long-chain acyl-CoA synthetase
MFFTQERAHYARAAELTQEPPKGKPYSVAIPGTEKEGRSPIYRSWWTQKELVKTLDPNVRIKLGSLLFAERAGWS